MKLFLSSYHFGNHKPQLLKMLTGNKRAGIISNAGDVFPEDSKSMYMRAELTELDDMAIIGEPIDLRSYVDRTDSLRKKLDGLNMLWVTGGNTFVLRRAMRMSGLDTILEEKKQEDEFVYAGYSAGACVVTPTLRGLELVDEPENIPKGYDKEIIWEGLNFVPYSIAPHYQSEHGESSAINDVVEYFKQHNMPYKTLHDGEVIISETKN